MQILSTAEKPKYPKDWPPQDYYTEVSDVTSAAQQAFNDLLKENTGEKTADNFLRKHPALLGQCLNFTNFGHHGMWVIPQKLIDPGAMLKQRGLKPDYLFGGKSSDGFFFFF